MSLIKSFWYSCTSHNQTLKVLYESFNGVCTQKVRNNWFFSVALTFYQILSIKKVRNLVLLIAINDQKDQKSSFIFTARFDKIVRVFDGPSFIVLF